MKKYIIFKRVSNYSDWLMKKIFARLIKLINKYKCIYTIYIYKNITVIIKASIFLNN